MNEKIIAKSEKKIIYQIDDKIVKTYCEPYDVTQVLNEALNQAKISESNIHAPKIYEVKDFNGNLGIVMDYIKGENLLNLINTDKSNIDKYLNIFAKTQHKIFSSTGEFLNNSYGRIKKKIFASELPMNIKYGLFYRLREMEFAKDIIHGDYTLSNVIISEDGTPYILDWGHVSFGDKKLDIAISYILFIINGQNSLAEKYLDLICSLENISKEKIMKAMILAYIYIVDRYDESKQKNIYDKVYELIKLEEA